MKIGGKKLKQVRLALEYSQKEFANIIDVTQSTISMIETNRNGISGRLIEVLLCQFHVSPIWLFKDTGEMFSYSKSIATGNPKVKLTSKKQLINALRGYNAICQATPATLCKIAGITLESLTDWLIADGFTVNDSIAKLWATIGQDEEESGTLEITIQDPKN